MSDETVNYGLRARSPDLLDTVPGLGKLKSACPKYIEKAEFAQKTARDFAKNEIAPRVLEIDQKCAADPAYFDWELWETANAAKLNITPIPEKMGGLGWSALDNAMLVEELTSACMGCASNITFNTFGLLGAMVECKTDIVLKIISQMVDAQRRSKPLFWSWAITEPSAGTDVEDEEAMATMRPSTHAKKIEGGYLVNGTKCFITNGSLAHYVIATIPADSAHPKESMATFFIPTTTKGFSVGRIERKCGQKASQTAELFFKDVFVPEENVWEPPGKGLRHTREILSITRGFIGIGGLGIARGALERGIRYVSRKKVKNHRLIDEEWVQMVIADMIKDINTVRCAGINFAMALDAYHVWKMFDSVPVKAGLKIVPEKILLGKSLQALAEKSMFSHAGSEFKKKFVSDEQIETFVYYGSLVKVAGTDLAVNITSRVADMVGLEGLSDQYGIEKSFRDAKVTQIYEGSNQANRIDIVKHALSKMGIKNLGVPDENKP
ncbi:MAG: acyl-CoA/acyl-ACP dehydrogenase [Desulfobacteraceae bacterium]|nr:acyl-CoA/acyl-ACP dehydrogenase [Desulfobacteraceae bacterium]MBC2755717.1 acyl-CoA/acyl-ACP dehydrogenase [Desulfobacteraceae bacterium]